MFRTYWKNATTYKGKFKNGWYICGDRASIDREGYFWFVGRDDDVINTGGHLVGPFEIESALLEHPAVAESAAVGKPDPVNMEVVKAFVALKPGFEATDDLELEIMNFIRKRLSPLAMPQEIEFVALAPQDAERKDPAPDAARQGVGRADRRHLDAGRGLANLMDRDDPGRGMRKGRMQYAGDAKTNPRIREEGIPRGRRRHRDRLRSARSSRAGIVDSFSMVSLKTFLEKKYKISIPDAKATPRGVRLGNKIVEAVEGVHQGVGRRTWRIGASVRESSQTDIEAIRSAGFCKEERFIHSPQASEIEVEFPTGAAPKKVINLCANNYLGLSSHPDVIEAAHEGLDTRGYGMSSVRFICGTQDIHRELEKKLTEVPRHRGHDPLPLLHGRECRRLRGGAQRSGRDDLRPTRPRLHHRRDHASARERKTADTYKHSDMEHLEEKLQEHQDARIRLIITDGVFSMDGDIAKLDKIVRAGRASYDAMVFVDDSHASGFMGKTGRGTQEHCGVLGRIDIITTTLGKALGGASGGCVSGRREIVELCRQKARPYLFSNTMPPVIVAAAIKVIDLISLDDRASRQAREEHDLLAQGAHRGRLRHQGRRQPDRPGDALQREARRRHGPRSLCRGDLRHRLLLPRRAEGAGAHPHADLGRPRDRGS